MEEKDPKALPKVEKQEIRLSEAEKRIHRLEKRVEILERGKIHVNLRG